MPASPLIYDKLSLGDRGQLMFAGLDTLELAEEFGTPLYLLDEDRVRERCRSYQEALAWHMPEGSRAYYASKALCFKGIYPIIADEGMGADVVSPGEIATALAAGFPASDLCFHGTNKPVADIAYGVGQGVGLFVVDNPSELADLNCMAASVGVVQRVLLRVTVGLDPHTFAAVNTGRVDSQFGVPIETGQAAAFLKDALACEAIEVVGFHSHIGSQIFDASSFCDQVDILLAFALRMRDELGYVAEIFNLGGGFGVPYTQDDPELDIAGNIALIAEHLKAGCAAGDYSVPKVFLEPGRSIVADAGITLYTAGGVKTIEGYRSYVTVDGGMTDNPRYALYKSPYTVVNSSNAGDDADFECTIADRCCESGDRIAEDIRIARPQRGDIIAVLGTGAYNFAMSSNYNRVLRPALVVVSGGKARLAVRRQTIDDLLALEM